MLAHLWPELVEGVGVEQNEWHAYDVWRHSLATLDATDPGDLVLRLAALLHDVGKPRTKEGPHFYRHEILGAEMTRAMLERFRFSNDVVKTTEHLVRQHMYSADPELSDAALRRFIRRVGPENIERLFDSAMPTSPEAVCRSATGRTRPSKRASATNSRRKPAFSIRELAVSGDDVVAALVARREAAPDFKGDERVGAALRWLFEQVTDEPGRNERSLLLKLLEQYLDAPAFERAGERT